MILNKQELKSYIDAESRNYQGQESGWLGRFWLNLFADPICEQKYIWRYIKTLRLVEYYEYIKENNKLYLPLYIFHLMKLRKYSHITGLQIPPNVIGKGLTIWHWGPIIINSATVIGVNCTLYPGVLIGHKIPGGGSAVIGDNVFIGSGAKIIGHVRIGNNVVIGQNCVITKDIPDNTIVVCGSNRVLSVKHTDDVAPILNENFQ